MAKWAMVVLMAISLRQSQALGPYYAYVCSNQPAILSCPGDTLISFQAMIFTQYKPDQYNCGTIATDDTTLSSVCSTTIYQNGDTGTFVQQFNQACLGAKTCSLNFYIGLPLNGPCVTSANGTTGLIRVVYSCSTVNGFREAIVCSDMAGVSPTTQSLSCPSNQVIAIEDIKATGLNDGSSTCMGYIPSGVDFASTCSYTLASSHAYYRQVASTCSGRTACTVTGGLIATAQKDPSCTGIMKRNYQRIYYSCIVDLSQKLTVCASTQSDPPQLNCGTSLITISNVIANLLYNQVPTSCPNADAVDSFAVPGCSVGVLNTDPFWSTIGSQCNGKTSCTLTTLPKYTASPCSNNQTTRNWFLISYQCSNAAGSGVDLTARACNNSVLQLQCGPSTAISVSSVYATVLFATGTNLGDYSCQTALAVRNAELDSCMIELSDQGTGSHTYSDITSACNGQNACNVTLSDSVTGNVCQDKNIAVGVVKTYTSRNLYVVQYTCSAGAASGGSSTGSASNSASSLGLGLGLAALFIVLIIIVVAVVVYKRRNRDKMTTKLSTPSATGNYSNF